MSAIFRFYCVLILKKCRKLEKEMDELTKSRKSLQEEISRNKTSTSTLRAELQLEHKKAVESLTEKCHAHEKKLG